MTPHERQRQNQAAFAAMRDRLEALSDTRILYCDTDIDFADMKQQLQQLQIRHEDVTCRLIDGSTCPGFRLTTEAYIFLATLSLVNAN